MLLWSTALVCAALLVFPVVLVALSHRLGAGTRSVACRALATVPVAGIALVAPPGIALGAAVVVLVVALVGALSGPVRFLAALRTPVGEEGLDRFGWLTGQLAIAAGLMAPVVAAAALIFGALERLEPVVVHPLVATWGGLAPAVLLLGGDVLLAGTGPRGRIAALGSLFATLFALVAATIVLLTGDDGLAAPAAALLACVGAAVAASLVVEAAPRAVPVSGWANLSAAGLGAAVTGLGGAALAMFISPVGGATLAAVGLAWVGSAWGRAVRLARTTTAHTHDGDGCCSHDHADEATAGH